MRQKLADFALFAEVVGGLDVIIVIENSEVLCLSIEQLTGKQE